ncbi:hypothetical protein MUP77_21480 [Candidatus Bathyarchaeota archaeon]|nr:hypothetical protein [Candidatus Bathyarchaeota archaeon]
MTIEQEQAETGMCCLNIISIMNTGQGWGICVGVQKARPKAFYKDVVRMCCIKSHPKPGETCPRLQGFAMTPEEAEKLGAALIKSTVFGETWLKKEEEKKNKQP